LAVEETAEQQHHGCQQTYSLPHKSTIRHFSNWLGGEIRVWQFSIYL